MLGNGAIVVESDRGKFHGQSSSWHRCKTLADATKRIAPSPRPVVLEARRAALIWNLDEGHCKAVLPTLEDAEFLRRTSDVVFVRRS